MSIEFKYDETKLENGHYLVRVDGELTVAEHEDGAWWWHAVEYDHVQYRRDGPGAITVIAQLDLAAMAENAAGCSSAKHMGVNALGGQP